MSWFRKTESGPRPGAAPLFGTPDDGVNAQKHMTPLEADVIAVGQGRVSDDGTTRALTVAVGDRVLFGKYTGDEIKLDGEEHIILRESDILAIIDNS